MSLTAGQRRALALHGATEVLMLAHGFRPPKACGSSSLGGACIEHARSKANDNRAYLGGKPSYTREQFNVVRDMLAQAAVGVAAICQRGRVEPTGCLPHQGRSGRRGGCFSCVGAVAPQGAAGATAPQGDQPPAAVGCGPRPIANHPQV
jgi:hypothetical protein